MISYWRNLRVVSQTPLAQLWVSKDHSDPSRHHRNASKQPPIFLLFRLRDNYVFCMKVVPTSELAAHTVRAVSSSHGWQPPITQEEIISCIFSVLGSLITLNELLVEYPSYLISVHCSVCTCLLQLLSNSLQCVCCRMPYFFDGAGEHKLKSCQRPPQG